VAKRLRGDAAVLGYDIFNEPWPGTGWQACFPPQGCQSMDKNLLAPFSHRIITAIHHVDPHHLAFYEPWQPFSESAPTYVGSPGDNESGFSFHTYCAAALGAPETVATRAACNLVERNAINDGVKQATATGDAALLTEFGATTDTDELKAVEGYADGESVPWLEWAYCACDDPTGSGRVESLVYNPRRPPRHANVNHTTLPWLDEPYPQRIAGTPLGYSFDQATDTFRFRYSTQRPLSHRRTRGRTIIYTSPLHYRHGYRVTTKGGRVVRKGARHLAVRPNAHAKTVTVTLHRK
jgi:endoglycosylceramidase